MSANARPVQGVLLTHLLTTAHIFARRLGRRSVFAKLSAPFVHNPESANPVVRQNPVGLRQNGEVEEPCRRIITRQSDEPKLEIGDVFSIKEGVVGIVLARYVRSDNPGEVHYVVGLRTDEAHRGTH